MGLPPKQHLSCVNMQFDGQCTFLLRPIYTLRPIVWSCWIVLFVSKGFWLCLGLDNQIQHFSYPSPKMAFPTLKKKVLKCTCRASAQKFPKKLGKNAKWTGGSIFNLSMYTTNVHDKQNFAFYRSSNPMKIGVSFGVRIGNVVRNHVVFGSQKIIGGLLRTFSQQMIPFFVCFSLCLQRFKVR